MSLFSHNRQTERFGVIIDVGSGSVLTAIISSKSNAVEPTIIWSHREHAPLRNIESIDQSAKAVLTALLNALLRLDVEGRRALFEYKKSAKITDVQCCISAPWTYTVTKTINYTQEEEFEISNDLIEELVRSALQKVSVELNENNSANELGLKIIARTTMDVISNGYSVKDPLHEKAKSLMISHASVVTQSYLADEIDKLKEKIFPNTNIKKLSYILALYSVAKDFFSNQDDTCLVDVTYEATEIGVVRDGTLTYSTHTPFGAFSLAREISSITSVPLYEAFQYLHTEKPYEFMETLPTNQKNGIEQVFESYTQRLVDLFHETGDDLSIPKRILLHTDFKSEPLFQDLIEKAAKRTVKSEPSIKMVTPTILKKMPHTRKNSSTSGHENDTALLVSAQFFHKHNLSKMFEYS